MRVFWEHLVAHFVSFCGPKKNLKTHGKKVFRNILGILKTKNVIRTFNVNIVVTNLKCKGNILITVAGVLVL